MQDNYSVCQYFLASSHDAWDSPEASGRCRRYPPVMSFSPSSTVLWAYPVVDPNSPCGEFLPISSSLLGPPEIDSVL